MTLSRRGDGVQTRSSRYYDDFNDRCVLRNARRIRGNCEDRKSARINNAPLAELALNRTASNDEVIFKALPSDDARDRLRYHPGQTAVRLVTDREP